MTTTLPLTRFHKDAKKHKGINRQTSHGLKSRLVQTLGKRPMTRHGGDRIKI